MGLFEKLKTKTETGNARLWAEYRKVLLDDDPKSAPRLAELLGLLGLTEKHVLFHRAVLIESRAMAKDVLLLEPARKAEKEAAKKLGELALLHNETVLAVARQQELVPKLRRRTITLAERESDLGHLHRRFPELLGETKAVSEFPDSPSARLQNLARDLGLPRLISAEG